MITPKIKNQTTHTAQEQEPRNDNRTTNKRKPVFDPKRCVVIGDRKDATQIEKDEKVATIGRNKDITIGRITHTHSGKLMVQLSETKMVSEAVNTWDKNNFGGSTARKTTIPQYKQGVLKGIPIDIEEHVIMAELAEQGFANTIVKRFTKNKKPIRVVKVQFHCPEDLQRAIKNKVVIDHLKRHKREHRDRPQICYRCSAEFNDEHNDCNKDPKCINCKGAHPVTDRRCPKNQKLYERQNERMNQYKRIEQNPYQQQQCAD